MTNTLRLTAPPPRKRRGIRVAKARSYQSLEKEAARVRRVFGLKPSERFPSKEVFEQLDRWKIGPLPMDYGMANLPENTEAITCYDHKSNRIQICLSPQSYESLMENEARAVFTVPHELGHGVLHVRETVQMATMPHYNGLTRAPDHDVFYDSEWQADGFAAALLMPATALAELENTKHLDVGTVMELFGVSAEAARYRIENFQKRRKDLLLI